MGKIIQFPSPTEDAEEELAEMNNELDKDASTPPQARSESANGAPENEDESETGTENIFNLIASMPNCISRKITLQVLATAGFLLAGFALLILFKNLQSIFFFLIAGWIIWNTVMSIDDFKNGRIVEQAVVCVSVKVGLAKNTTRVVMRTANEENPSYYEYNLAGRQTKEFTPNKVYIIYVKEYMPQTLFAYQEL